jgi:hypothetical protein
LEENLLHPDDFINESRAATFLHNKTEDPSTKDLQPEEKARQTHTKNMSYYSRRDYILSGGVIEPMEQSPQADEEQKLEEDEENIDEDNDEAEISKPKITKTELSKVHEDLQWQEDEKEDPSPKFKKGVSIATTAPGLKLPLTELNRTKGLNIKVLSHEIVNEGFFSASYLSFKIQVLPWETIIDRRDKDFNTLREYFVKAYPHILIPPISSKKNTKKNDEWYIHKRTNLITRFINKWLDIDELKASEVFLEFLTTKNSKTATKVVKTGLDSVKPPEDCSQYATMSGEHKIIENPQVKKFSDKFSIYMNSYDVLSAQFYSLSRQLDTQYEEIASTQKKMAEWWKHLKTMYKISNSEQLSEMYGQIEVSMKNWAKWSKEHCLVIKHNFVDFYKFMTLEKQALASLNDLKNTFTQNYQKAESILSAKKEKLFKSGTTSKWELSTDNKLREVELKKDKELAYKWMLPQETTRLNHLRTNYLMISTQWYKEVRRSNGYDYQLTKKNYLEVAKCLNSILNEELETVGKMLEKI